MTQAQQYFLADRVYAIKARLDLAARRIERAGEQGFKAEEERAHRLSKLLVLHETQPEEALHLYEK